MKAYALRLIVVAALLTPFVAARADDTVKLAYIAYMSGPFALLGEEALKAFQAAADIVNSQGGVDRKSTRLNSSHRH